MGVVCDYIMALDRQGVNEKFDFDSCTNECSESKSCKRSIKVASVWRCMHSLIEYDICWLEWLDSTPQVCSTPSVFKSKCVQVQVCSSPSIFKCVQVLQPIHQCQIGFELHGRLLTLDHTLIKHHHHDLPFLPDVPWYGTWHLSGRSINALRHTGYCI